MTHVAASSALLFLESPRQARPIRTIDDAALPVQIPPSRGVGFQAVLVICEDLGTTATAAGALCAIGCTVEIARSGADALAIARFRRFDFMLLDQQSPDMADTDLRRLLLNAAAAGNVPSCPEVNYDSSVFSRTELQD